LYAFTPLTALDPVHEGMMSEFFVHLLSLNSRVESTVAHAASVYFVTFMPPVLGGAFKPFAATTD